jgi:hypothetical protein
VLLVALRANYEHRRSVVAAFFHEASVHVNEGGQGIIGNVRSGTSGEGSPIGGRVSNEIDVDRDE